MDEIELRGDSECSRARTSGVAAVLLSVLLLAAGSSCSNRLYRRQRLNVSQFLCSRNQNYRLLVPSTGQVQINEPFPRETSFKPPPQTLFSTNATSPSPSHVTFTESGDFVAVGMDGAVYWQAGVAGADFLELQDTGVAVLFARNASTLRVLWKSLSMYSLRLVGGASAGRLEFYFSSAWGSVSNVGFDASDADVACRTLGFDTGLTAANTFGVSTGSIWMDNMQCNGREGVFHECPFGGIWSSPPRNWWGIVYSPSHSDDVAVSCQGTSSLGVLAPIAHVCSDRLYVGQALSLGDSLCAGPSGEYTLRFSNKRLDTVIELWYKMERKWSIGMTNWVPAGAAARLDGDGVMRVVGSAAGLPYSLFNDTVANASFVELQDNGVVRVVSANGSTGWRKAPDDICYTEKRKIYSYDNSKKISSRTTSPLDCLAFCDSNPTCKTVVYDENVGSCTSMSGYPWDASVVTTAYSANSDVNGGTTVTTYSSTYYQKTPGCSSGPSCYQSSSYDRWSLEPSLSPVSTAASGSACTSLCDTTANCVSAYFNPSATTSTCTLGWKRLNETVDNLQYTSYYKKSPCTPVAPALLPVKDCPTMLLPGSFLLPRQYLCSRNGQHVLTVEYDGRMLIDGGKWTSNNATNRSGYLQYSLSSQLILRLDDNTVPWKVDSISIPAGYLALSDTGKLQMFDITGALFWDHESGLRTAAPLVPLDDSSRPWATYLVDGNPATCVTGRSSAMLSYQLGQMRLNQTLTLTLFGQSLRCGSVASVGNYLFSMSHLTTSGGGTPLYGEEHNCRLLSDASQSCRFECVCQSVTCEVLTLWYVGCGNPDGSVCEMTIQ